MTQLCLFLPVCLLQEVQACTNVHISHNWARESGAQEQQPNVSSHLIPYASTLLLDKISTGYEGSFLRWGCLNWRQCIRTLDDHVLFKTILLGLFYLWNLLNGYSLITLKGVGLHVAFAPEPDHLIKQNLVWRVDEKSSDSLGEVGLLRKLLCSTEPASGGSMHCLQ
jgi:hypothetical protein